ncbi:MAG: SsrA-binding protein SmpB [Alphaproteobacteria bacterium]|nr:SsrA-binding protein SmpB [Alphaproteobacteria bacterium]
MARALTPADRYVAQNRKARHNYAIDETLETGIVLTGSEVKSLRLGRCSLNDAYAAEKNGELYLFNMHIAEYPSSREDHHPTRSRKLLVHRREKDRLFGAVKREGMALVPLALYFNDRGIAKVSLGLAKGKRKIDKRADEKAREWRRQKERLLKEKS